MIDPMNRREFLGQATAMATAAGLMGMTRAARADEDRPAGGKLSKAVIWDMLPDNLAIADRFKLAVDVGFEGIEAQTTVDQKVVDQMLAGAKKAGIPIHSVMTMGHWEYPLSSPDPETAKKGVETVKLTIDNAKAWGADAVLLVPGVVTSQTRYKEAYERSQKAIREQVLPAAQAAGVTVAIENVWNKFLLSPLEFARYIDEIKNQRLTAYFDVGNNVQYGFPEDWILTLGPRIKRMHLKDFKRATNKFVGLGEGDVDWPAVRKAISEIGYSGFVTVELPGGDEAYLRDVVKRVDRLLP